MCRHRPGAPNPGQLQAADAAGVVWDETADSSDREVYARLFPGRSEHQSVFAQPDWDQVHREMARVGVTLKLLHGEYADSCAATGEPMMGYDRFCRTYQRHVLVTGVASRVGYKAGQTGLNPRSAKWTSERFPIPCSR